jgi:hypothetical protein
MRLDPEGVGRRMSRHGVFALLAALLAMPAFGQPAPPLTYTQLSTLPPEELGRRLLGEMSQILYLYPPEGRASVPFPGPGRPSRLDFLSRPRAAEAAGICETDLVSVSYDLPVEAGILDPPIRLLGMSLTTLSFIDDLPLVRRGDARDRRGDAALDSVCAAADPRTRSLLRGRGPSVRAVRAIADLIDEARTGRLPEGTTCAAGAPDVCLRTLAGLRAEDMERESICGRRLQSCSRVTLRPYEIELVFAEGLEGAASIRVLPLRAAPPEPFRRNMRDAPPPAIR